MTLDPLTPVPAAGLGALAVRWKTLAALGILMIVLSAVAFVLIAQATVASVLMIGAFMAVIGVAEIVLAFQARTWGRFLLWVVAGALYLLAGLVTLGQPVMAAAFFTLFVGAGLVATGAMRLVMAFGLGQGAPRGIVVLAAVITLLLGLLIVAGWPSNSLVVLGALLAADLLFYGIAWLSLAIALRNRPAGP
jgi:uncharacterized membrane protein HdeD (DUF308 family)